MNSRAVTRRPISDFLNGPAGGLLLVTLVIICYAYTLNFSYIWDDDQYVTANTSLQSFAGLSRIWTDIAASLQYYPVTLTSFWIEYQLFGLNPALSHGVNVALHACTVLMLFYLLKQLRVPGAWLAAAVFAVHPINVESVAWITERKNTLSLALGFAATLIYLRYCGLIATAAPAPAIATPADKDRNDGEDGDDVEPMQFNLPTEPGRLYLLFLVFFVAAVLSKSTMAALPGVLFVILWWKRGWLLRNDVVPLLLPVALALGFGIMASNLERSTGYVGATGPEWDFGIGRLQLIGQTAWFYVGKVLLPHPFIFYQANWQRNVESALALPAPEWLRSVLPWPLMFNYPRWKLDPADARQWVGVVGVVATVTGAFVFRRRFGRGLLAGVLIYLGCLLPASGLFNVYPMRFSYVADHFAYMAVIPIIVMVVVGLSALASRVSRREWLPAAGGAVLLALLAAVTLIHSKAFQNPQMLWEATLIRNNESWLAAANYGSLLVEQAKFDADRLYLDGKPDEAKAKSDRLLNSAEAWFNAAIRRNPDSYEAYYQLAGLALQRNKLDVALAQAQKSQEVAEKMRKDSFLQPRAMIAQLMIRKRDYQAADNVYRELQTFETKYSPIRPMFFASLRTDYGDLLMLQLTAPLSPNMNDADRDRMSVAMDQYSRAIELAPQSIQPKLRAARILVETDGPPQMALQLLQDVLSIDKTVFEAQFLAARVGLQTHEYESAGAQLMALIKTQPRYLPSYVRLAEAYDAVDRRPEAIATIEQALKLQPDYKPAIEMLAKLKGTATQPATNPAAAPPTHASQ